MSQIEIFTDGACKGNPGIGGWGVLLRAGTHVKHLSGVELESTNNRMELTAAIQGLKALKRPSQVQLFTDSQYVQKGMTCWITRWQQMKWMNQHKEPVKNVDLWLQLLEASQPHKIEWIWVKGHSGHPENDIVDRLATQAIEHYREKSQCDKLS